MLSIKLKKYKIELFTARDEENTGILFLVNTLFYQRSEIFEIQTFKNSNVFVHFHFILFIYLVNLI